jgi:hypothetical protein
VQMEWDEEFEYFQATVELPPALGEKIAYKFAVDGEWKHSEDRNTADDGVGGLNNILIARVPKARLPTGVNTEGATEAYKQQFKEVSFEHHFATIWFVTVGSYARSTTLVVWTKPFNSLSIRSRPLS